VLPRLKRASHDDGRGRLNQRKQPRLPGDLPVMVAALLAAELDQTPGKELHIAWVNRLRLVGLVRTISPALMHFVQT